MSRDPYKYFRVEARELLEGLGKGALDLEKGRGGPALVQEMLRLAHTLKGAARVVKQPKMAQVAHEVEELFASHREAGTAPAKVDDILRAIDAMTELLAAIDAPAQPAPSSDARAPAASSTNTAHASTGDPLRHIRVEIEEMDRMLVSVAEAGVRLTALRHEIDAIGAARDLAATVVELSPPASRARTAAEDLRERVGRIEGALRATLDQAEHEIDEVRDRAGELRLMPAGAIFPTLERSARDAAEALGKTIAFEASGGEHRLEANVLLPLRDALIHVVRNAVAHGVESESERRAAGKSIGGSVRVDVERRAGRVVFRCRDDGRGIDREAVRRAAVARGLMTTEQAASLDADRVIQLALESGVSTTARADQLSGRGVGLDVVRATMIDLKGEVRIASEPSRGTTVELAAPTSMTSVRALVFEAAGIVASLPLELVRRTMLLEGATSDRVLVDDRVVPLVSLATMLRGAAAGRLASSPRLAVVVAVDSDLVAIGVDRLVGTASLVVRPLPKLCGRASLVAGASLDAQGDPLLVLDARGLVDRSHAATAPLPALEAIASRAPILIIDDSLTTRMLEQSILESAGYAVDLATSAEEGLEKAAASPHALFLVDVEMPGIDGFEFVTKTRADPVLRMVPAILVTSRNAPEDRRRGEEAGASAYIVKGEFDQDELLRSIRRLIG